MNTKKWIILIVAVVVIAGFVYLVFFKEAPRINEAERFSVGQITKEIVDERAVLLDVRTEQELQQEGHALGSIHFDVTLMEQGQLPEISKEMKIYTYCKAGTRAEKAKNILEAAGFTDVTNIGGFLDWERAGGEVVR
jgi:rhodanese-related sulfurtransferase